MRLRRHMDSLGCRGGPIIRSLGRRFFPAISGGKTALLVRAQRLAMPGRRCYVVTRDLGGKARNAWRVPV